MEYHSGFMNNGSVFHLSSIQGGKGERGGGETVKPTLMGQRYRGHEQTRGNKRKSQSKRNLMADFFFLSL